MSFCTRSRQVVPADMRSSACAGIGIRPKGTYYTKTTLSVANAYLMYSKSSPNRCQAADGVALAGEIGKDGPGGPFAGNRTNISERKKKTKVTGRCSVDSRWWKLVWCRPGSAMVVSPVVPDREVVGPSNILDLHGGARARDGMLLLTARRACHLAVASVCIQEGTVRKVSTT